jgi:hypothetical protein
MALQINSTDNFKIKIYPTGEELASVYGKYSFKVFQGYAVCNGAIYENATTSSQELPLPTNIKIRQIMIKVEDGQTDTLSLHTKLKEYYEGLGYTVSILDI